MWRLATNGSNDDSRLALVDIIKDAELTDADFPDRLNMFPGRYQSGESLLVARFLGWLVGQLHLDVVENCLPVKSTQVCKVLDDPFAELDGEHTRSCVPVSHR